jgi:RHS repeat-associated protein
MSMGTSLRSYSRGHTLVSMQDGVPNTTRYYHFDHQGTTQCLTNEAGVVTDRFASDAWGVEVKRTGSSINRHWYIGDAGYYSSAPPRCYVRARTAETPLGRWISADPSRGEHHLYTYAANSPARLVDPSGRVAECLRKPKNLCFECLYRGYSSNKGRFHYCPMKACEEANQACGTRRLCGTCGPGPDPIYRGGCTRDGVTDFAHFLRGSAGKDACGGVDGADKVAHCWGACMAHACGAGAGCVLIWLGWPEESDEADKRAEGQGLDCALEGRSRATMAQDCLSCCGRKTHDAACY